MTKIEWATHTVNWLSGCTKVSPACVNCYAETMSARLATMPHAPDRYRDGVVDGRRWTGRISYDAHALNAAFSELLSARTPRRVFVNSMSDTFHDAAPRQAGVDLAHQIEHVERQRRGGRRWPHKLLLLTKRPHIMLAWQREWFPAGLPTWVWCGATVEDQQRAGDRIAHLVEVSYARTWVEDVHGDQGVRFLSVEPQLGRISVQPYLWLTAPSTAGPWRDWTGRVVEPGGRGGQAMASKPSRYIGWVIVGGESGGSSARPTHPDWLRQLRDECRDAGVPFFFKQWGEWRPCLLGVSEVGVRFLRSSHGVVTYPMRGDGTRADPFGDEICGDVLMERVRKAHSGRLLDGVLHDAVPGEVPRG